MQGLNWVHDLASLILKQIDRMAGVVPKEMIRPTAWLTQSVEVAAAEEVSLNDQVLNA